MKRIVLLICLIVFLGTPSLARADKGEFSIGIKGGYSYFPQSFAQKLWVGSKEFTAAQGFASQIDFNWGKGYLDLGFEISNENLSARSVSTMESVRIDANGLPEVYGEQDFIVDYWTTALSVAPSLRINLKLSNRLRFITVISSGLTYALYNSTQEIKEDGPITPQKTQYTSHRMGYTAKLTIGAEYRIISRFGIGINTGYRFMNILPSENGSVDDLSGMTINGGINIYL